MGWREADALEHSRKKEACAWCVQFKSPEVSEKPTKDIANSSYGLQAGGDLQGNFLKSGNRQCGG